MDVYQFKGCTSLRYINLTNIKKIANSIFENCTALIEIDFSHVEPDLDNMEYMGYICAGCKSLNSVKLCNTQTVIGKSAFAYCSSLKNIEIPNTVKIIEELAFRSVPLTNVKLPNGLIKLGVYSFRESKLINITIPKTVTDFSGSEFELCPCLWAKVLPTTPPNGVNKYTFTNGAKYPIYVPDDSIDSYKSATNWSAYASRIEPLSSFTE